ncbi:MAG: PAS domain-containing hybrid sensor histidine kinase/response regulator [Bacteroidia bacterium]
MEEVKRQDKDDLGQDLKELEDYKHALDACSNVAITDEKGIIKYANDNFCKATKYPREELIGQDHRIINSGYHLKKFIDNLWETITSGKIWRGELRNKAKDGSIYWVDTTIVPSLNEKGKPYQYIGIRTDITERKIYEHELRKAVEIAQIAAEIAEAGSQKAKQAQQLAEDTVKSKQRFLANMSHEIRTPMNSVIGFTNVLLKTDLTTKQKEYLSAIKTSGESLIVLINDILDLAKVNAGKISFEHLPFKIGVSLSSMFFLFETKAQEKGLKLIKEYDNKIPEILVGDSARLHQVLLNLLSNSLKFTTAGKIIISVRLLSEDTEKVTLKFSVTDTGIGISEEGITKIFNSFEQASSSTTRLFGGTGLGLAIVKELVEKQGGTISVKSKIGEGSTFSFILSFQKTTAKLELETAIVDLDTEIKGIRVLVAEDHSLNQLLIRTILDDFGFERDIVADGEEAIEKLRTKTYDIILMDLIMPVMGGLEATEYIRNTMNSKIPIIALTADVTTIDLAKCKALGLNDYLAKPIDEHLLYSKIVGLVKKS